ncbi:Na+/H+ antiporter NhaA [Botrimarina sp.]|uniref:Na+/H+ antiporter NhaA n=1 Tax=Botrimarina sp. TaxID=2795802 RepID=UPI0032ED4DC0
MAGAKDSASEAHLPREPIHRLTGPIRRFLHVEAASGFVLLACAVVALSLANSPFSEAFLGIWKTPLALTIGDFRLEHSLKHWINDGLMAIFFFVIGLEVKREIVIGELRTWRSASLPVAAALGGMLVPAVLYLLVLRGGEGSAGWGVPMATDIAFVVGCMSVLGSRTPHALRVILLSIAIVDDIGAILVIAIGYTDSLHTGWLAAGCLGIGLVVVMQRVGVRSIGVYTAVGAAVWLAFHESGVHATLAGVVLGLLTPARPYLKTEASGELLRKASDLLHGGGWSTDTNRAAKVRGYRRATRETISPVEYLIYRLHPWVAFAIMPLFAIANAGVEFRVADVASPVAVGVILGLVIGKPLGVLAASWLSLSTGLASLPAGVGWRHLFGGAALTGIGFTMALFIAGLAFADPTLLRSAKVGVLVASLVAALLGMTVLALTKPQPEAPQ